MTAIENDAFAGCSGLTEVDYEPFYHLYKIGDRAFYRCSSLTEFYISSRISEIGDGAFAGCNKFDISQALVNSNYSSEDNILYNEDKTKIISACNIAPNIRISETVTTIAHYAFAGNANLVSVRFSHIPTIGEYAFYNCQNMNSVYFDTYDVPNEVGENSFSNNDFVLYTMYNVQNEYRNIFGNYAFDVVSLPLKIFFISNGQIIETKEVYNGSTISDLPTPSLTGHVFGGWYSDDSYSGTPYQNGGLWESKTDLYLYAQWTPKEYTVTLKANGGELQGEDTFKAIYGEAFSTTSIAIKTGNMLEGWYDGIEVGSIKYMSADGKGMDIWKYDGNITLYAQWTVEAYEIQINDDGSIV